MRVNLVLDVITAIAAHFTAITHKLLAIKNQFISGRTLNQFKKILFNTSLAALQCILFGLRLRLAVIAHNRFQNHKKACQATFSFRFDLIVETFRPFNLLSFKNLCKINYFSPWIFFIRFLTHLNSCVLVIEIDVVFNILFFSTRFCAE